ncbi:DUF4266 domain-containing protein [Acanthopleuribacter pedis]|uniref:DUF4266 domain-containing protein n=2 Tax=Acanthopleuribacter pedis TaxID=442870 RepID=A0A8J7U3Z2_9BACT|nr:DUF4266 domain-containing protein [Acanthopleuribacter pedis]MBO1319274.1 DUF4266 domain-containing protein [Acanthopleuribacter pedis]
MKRAGFLLFMLLLCAASFSCSQVKPWQKGTLSLQPMQVDDCLIHRFERNAEVYREGAAGGNGGKSGGGCGCS